MRQLAQIYNIYLCICICPASMSVTNLWYKFPTSKTNNETHKPRLQEPWNQKNKKTKRNKKNKIARPMKPKKTKNQKNQDCKTHESSNLGTLGSDILVFWFFWFSCFFWFSWFSLPGSQVSAQNAQTTPLYTRSLFYLVFDGLSTPTENCGNHTKITLPRFENRRRKPIAAWSFIFFFNVPGCACITLREYDIPCLGCPFAQIW